MTLANRIYQRERLPIFKSFELSKQDGFTLIELLVVISIISLLASILLVAVVGARAKARDSQRVSNVSQIKTALELYYSDNNAYPIGTYYSGWDSGNYPGSDHHCWCQSTSTSGSLEQGMVSGGRISKLPEDPSAAEGDGNYLSDGQGRGVTVRKIVDIYRRQKNKNSPLAFVLPWF